MIGVMDIAISKALDSYVNTGGLYLIPLEFKRDSKKGKFLKPPCISAIKEVTGQSSINQIPQDDKTIQALFSNSKVTGIGVKMGRDSGYLEAIDIDTKFDDTKRSITNQFFQRIPKELGKKLVIIGTATKGYHVVYRYKSEKEENPHLCSNDKGQPIIQRIGGGYIATVGTKGYQFIRGEFKEAQFISETERNLLKAIAESLNKKPTSENNKTPSLKSSSNPIAAIDHVLNMASRKGLSFTDGQRHSFIIFAASQLNSYGVEKEIVEAELSIRIQLDQYEDHFRQIEDIYKRQAEQFNSNPYKSKGERKKPLETVKKPHTELTREEVESIFKGHSHKVIEYGQFGVGTSNEYLPRQSVRNAIKEAQNGKTVLMNVPAGGGKTYNTLVEINKDQSETFFLFLVPYRIQAEQELEQIKLNDAKLESLLKSKEELESKRAEQAERAELNRQNETYEQAELNEQNRQNEQIESVRSSLYFSNKIHAATTETQENVKDTIRNIESRSQNCIITTHKRFNGYLNGLRLAKEKGAIKNLVIIIDESHTLPISYSYKGSDIDKIQAAKEIADGIINLTATPSPYCLKSSDSIIYYQRVSNTVKTYQTFYTRESNNFGKKVSDYFETVSLIEELAEEVSIEQAKGKKMLIQVYCENTTAIQTIVNHLEDRELISKESTTIIVGDKEEVTTTAKIKLNRTEQLPKSTTLFLHTSTCVQAINIKNDYDQVYCICPILNEADYSPRNSIQASNRCRKAKAVHLIRLVPRSSKDRIESDFLGVYERKVGYLTIEAEKQIKYYSEQSKKEQKRLREEVIENNGKPIKSFKEFYESVIAKPKLLSISPKNSNELQINEMLIQHIAISEAEEIISEADVIKELEACEFVKELKIKGDFLGRIDKDEKSRHKTLVTLNKIQLRKERTKEVTESEVEVLNRVANINSNTRTKSIARQQLGILYRKTEKGEYTVEDQLANKEIAKHDCDAMELVKRGINPVDAYKIAEKLPEEETAYLDRLLKSLDYAHRTKRKSILDKNGLLEPVQEEIKRSVRGKHRIKTIDVENALKKLLEAKIKEIVKPKIDKQIERKERFEKELGRITTKCNPLASPVVTLSKVTVQKNVGIVYIEKDKTVIPKKVGFAYTCICNIYIGETDNFWYGQKTGGNFKKGGRATFTIQRDILRCEKAIDKLLNSPIKLPRAWKGIEEVTAYAMEKTPIASNIERLGYVRDMQKYISKQLETILYTAFHIEETQKNRYIEKVYHGDITLEAIQNRFDITFDIGDTEEVIINRVKESLAESGMISNESEPEEPEKTESEIFTLTQKAYEINEASQDFIEEIVSNCQSVECFDKKARKLPSLDRLEKLYESPKKDILEMFREYVLSKGLLVPF